MENKRMKRSLGVQTLAVPTPVWLIATYDANGKPNVMTIAWGGICSSQPPSVTVSIRKANYSHSAIVARKSFTVNIPSTALVSEADYVGTVSGREVDKFSVARFTAVRSSVVDAPYIEEIPLVLECALTQTHEVGIHTQFVGEIRDVKADESVLTSDGLLDIAKVAPIVYDPARRGYWGLGTLVGHGWDIGKKIGVEAAK
jgi:flavin reductase (DIM6/NTAB) family NADH-FMN oxidoreductase RutF